MTELLAGLNPRQQSAVTTENDNVLILAGAGSGKTKTIITRIVYLIREKGVDPSQILAVTFTNKAANEMKERVEAELGPLKNLMIKTFHSFGAYILRRECAAAGRGNNYQIYDDDDSRKVLGEIIKGFQMDRKMVRSIKSWVSRYKQNLEDSSAMTFQEESYYQIYESYEKRLQDSNCFDFEDLILKPIKIFDQFPQLAASYRDRFRYVLVDEYQDTNNSQFNLLKHICADDTRLMVVGDEDQSIYRFRGADISIILNFAAHFKSAEVIKLEQNYRSTSNILKLANNVIKNNTNRLGKTLFSEGAAGEKVLILDSSTESGEADNVSFVIGSSRLDYDQTAVLVRTNNQTRAIEQAFNREGIPYVVVGSIGFFDREEIRDALLLIKWLINSNDRVAFERFVNKPARGIGKKSLETFYSFLPQYENDIFKALAAVQDIKGVPLKARKALFELYHIIKDKDSLLESEGLADLLRRYLKDLGLRDYYAEKDEQTATFKIQNLEEYITSINKVEPGRESVQHYLEEIMLTSNIRTGEEEMKGAVKIMTVHNAKGLEFDNVFICGLEDGLFPHSNSSDDAEEFEEERRLFYVAITRARKRLFLSFSYSRNIYGSISHSSPSQFLYELDKSCLDTAYLRDKRIFSNSTRDTNGRGGKSSFNGDISGGCDFCQGDVVRHKNYGKGKIISIKNREGKHLAQVDFWDHYTMELILEYTKLERVEEY